MVDGVSAKPEPVTLSWNAGPCAMTEEGVMPDTCKPAGGGSCSAVFEEEVEGGPPPQPTQDNTMINIADAGNILFFTFTPASNALQKRNAEPHGGKLHRR